MDKAEVEGSVRMVYYPMEKDSTILYMNVSEASTVDVYLVNRKMKRLVMKTQPNGVLYPLEQAPADRSRLDNFAWFDYIRPLNKEDIFHWRGKKAGQELKKNVRGNVPLPNQKLFENNQKE